MSDLPEPPKRPIQAHIIYTSDAANRAAYKAAHPEVTNTELMSALNTAWKALSEEERAPFVERAAAAKAAYDAALAEYKEKYGDDAPTRYAAAKKAAKTGKGAAAAVEEVSATSSVENGKKAILELAGSIPAVIQAATECFESDKTGREQLIFLTVARCASDAAGMKPQEIEQFVQTEAEKVRKAFKKIDKQTLDIINSFVRE